MILILGVKEEVSLQLQALVDDSSGMTEEQFAESAGLGEYDKKEVSCDSTMHIHVYCVYTYIHMQSKTQEFVR